jgi:hypothetical protein
VSIDIATLNVVITWAAPQAGRVILA